jgi:hypothetical protein
VTPVLGSDGVNYTRVFDANGPLPPDTYACLNVFPTAGGTGITMQPSPYVAKDLWNMTLVGALSLITSNTIACSIHCVPWIKDNCAAFLISFLVPKMICSHLI